MTSTPPLSFEFFPPKTSAGRDKLDATAQALASWRPQYFSVTCGAGGSTRVDTPDTVRRLHETSGIPVAPHLSCIAESRAELAALLGDYADSGVQRIVALRGDLPEELAPAGELRYARDLVEFIRTHWGDRFRIEVAAYPEVHPQAENADTDFEHFHAKMRAGADAAITQYFFDADAYFRFLERCHKAGLEAPIIPGIMPIADVQKLLSFSAKCGALIPPWLDRRLAALERDPQGLAEFAAETVTRLCRQLLDGGAPGIHFYTLNQAEPTLAVCRGLLRETTHEKKGTEH